MKKMWWARLLMGLLIFMDVRGSSRRWFFHRLLLGVVPTRGEDPEMQ